MRYRTPMFSSSDSKQKNIYSEIRLAKRKGERCHQARGTMYVSSHHNFLFRSLVLTRLFLDGESQSASDDYLSRKAKAQEVNFTRNVRTETIRDPRTRVSARRVTMKITRYISLSDSHIYAQFRMSIFKNIESEKERMKRKGL